MSSSAAGRAATWCAAAPATTCSWLGAATIPWKGAPATTASFSGPPTARGGAAADHLTLRGFGIPALQAILAAAVQDGADTVLHYGEDSVRLVGVGKAELALQDLLF